MEQFELSAEPRDKTGRSINHSLRQQGKLPGVIYGASKENEHISLSHNDVLHHLENEAFFSHILTLKINKKQEKVVLKDLHRHPYKPNLLHIDFLRIKPDERIHMRVPLHYTNEDTCVGVKSGGVISHLVSDIEIHCLPADLPEYIEIDMQNVDLEQTLHLDEIVLPKGVEHEQHGGESRAIVSVHMPKVVSAEPEEATPDQTEEDGTDTDN